jgi:chemotaxis protein MotB
MRRKNEEMHDEAGGGRERWLLTYSDMITLLLVLFIMMYTISTVDSKKFEALASQLKSALSGSETSAPQGGQDNNGTGPVFSLDPSPAQATPGVSPQPTGNMDQIKSRIEAMIAQAEMQGFIGVRQEERGIVVSLSNALLFPSGSATINEQGRVLLGQIAAIINSVDNYIHVEGSADNVPIRSAAFPSNWELASQRAINVAKEIIAQNVAPQRVAAVSFGEYRPVASNDQEENRKYNRRVDIVFVNPELSKYEAGLHP